MRKHVSLRAVLLALIAWGALSMASWAQGNYRSVLLIKVKLEKQDDWKAAVKEIAGVYRKAGVENPFTVWESMTGPNQFAVVWYTKTLGEIDQDDPKLKPYEAEVKSIFSRIAAADNSGEKWVDEMQPDLWVRGASVPAYVRTGRTHIMPGKMDDALALFKQQLIPAMKKSGATDFGMAVGRFGTPSNEIHSYLGLSSLSQLDSPMGIKKVLSEEEYKAYMAKVSTLASEGTQYDLWKFQPELSYVPAAAAK